MFLHVFASVELQCQDPIIYELMQEDDVNPYQLISAQLQVVKSMEQNWCGICTLNMFGMYHILCLGFIST